MLLLSVHVREGKSLMWRYFKTTCVRGTQRRLDALNLRKSAVVCYNYISSIEINHLLIIFFMHKYLKMFTYPSVEDIVNIYRRSSSLKRKNLWFYVFFFNKKPIRIVLNLCNSTDYCKSYELLLLKFMPYVDKKL